MHITKHFTWEEVIASSTAERQGIDNKVPKEYEASIIHTAVCMEAVRLILDKPIHIDSWYRCPILNITVGGSKTSQHMLGEAVDFKCPDFGTPLMICRALIAKKLSFDQLILEHSWVHISFRPNSTIPNRRQVLSLLANKHYATGLTNSFGISYDKTGIV